MKRALLVVGVLGTLYAGAGARAQGDPPAAAGPPEGAPLTVGLGAREAAKIATEAYLFAYPLVTMHMTERVATNTRRAGPDLAPVGQLANRRHYPEPSDHTTAAPRADTLSSTAWLDLAQGPMVFSHPDMGSRFYMFPMLDAYTNVIRTPGARDNGGAAATYVITGPEWKGQQAGQIPRGAIEIKSPTNMVWILGQTASSGTLADDATVRRLQAEFRLRPLDAGEGWKPPPGRVDPAVDMKTAVRTQVDAMKAEEFFSLAARLMGANPPAPGDEPIMARMARIGIVPGQPFRMSALPADVVPSIAAAPRNGQQRIRAQLGRGGAVMVNGWLITAKAGGYGTDYVQRAFVAAEGLGAGKPEQAVDLPAQVDGSGQRLNGQNAYVIHFASGELPPAKGPWSITMYTPRMYFYPNSIKRYAVSSRTDLHRNEDGSVDVYVQNGKPASAEQRSNWLPAPREGFVLVMRIHWPEARRPSILDGSWQPPPIKRAGAAPPRMARTPPPRR
jgi:hypothetical protein